MTVPIAKTEYAPGQEEPVDRLRRLKIERQVSANLALGTLLRAYVSVIVKYPPHEDRHFETEPMKLNPADVGPDRDGYGRPLP